jgi:hypothetical protein
LRLSGLDELEKESCPNPLAVHPGAPGDLGNRPAENWQFLIYGLSDKINKWL